MMQQLAQFQSTTDCLLPTVGEQLSRVRNDLRLGLPCIITQGTTKAVIAAIEPLSQGRLDALCQLFGGFEIVLTANRGQVVTAGAPDFAPSNTPFRVKPPTHVDLHWLRALADTQFDHDKNPPKPLEILTDHASDLPAFGLTLVKSAQLLPAIVLFPVPHEAHFDFAQIDCDTAAHHLAAPAIMSSVASASLPIMAHDNTKLHVFRDPNALTEHYALEVGTPDRASPVLTRLHSACFTGDVLGSLKCDCGPQLHAALALMGEEGAGVLLYLNQEGRGIGLGNKMRAYDLQTRGYDTVEANHRLGFDDDERDFSVAAEMLQLLGFDAVKLLTNNPRKVNMLAEFGITTTERLPLKVGKNPHNSHYLTIKALKSGHAL